MKKLVLVPPDCPGVGTPSGMTDRWQVVVVEDDVAVGARLHKELRPALLQMYHDGSPYEVMSRVGTVRWSADRMTVDTAKALLEDTETYFPSEEVLQQRSDREQEEAEWRERRQPTPDDL